VKRLSAGVVHYAFFGAEDKTGGVIKLVFNQASAGTEKEMYILLKHHRYKIKMIIGLELNFKDFSLDGRFYIEMMDKYVHYQPRKFSFGRYVKNWNEKKHRKVIEESTVSDDLSLGFVDYNSFSAGRIQAVAKPYQIFSITQDSDFFNPSNDEIENMIARKGFSCAYLYDYKYEKQQSAVFESDYAVFGISMELSNGLPYKMDYTGQKKFDISGNPGRENWISSTGLLACWKMWFGEEFYNLVPKERLLNFKGAFKIEELPNDVVFVQLFEKVEDSPTKQAQEIQWFWRKWLNFDELIKKNP